MRITHTKDHTKGHRIELSLAIADLLAKGAVKEVEPQDNQFTSTLFLVQKENGDFRPVINLLAFNRFLGKEYSKIEGLQVVWSLLYDETRPEGCISCSSTSPRSQEVNEVCVSGQHI